MKELNIFNYRDFLGSDLLKGCDIPLGVDVEAMMMSLLSKQMGENPCREVLGRGAMPRNSQPEVEEKKDYKYILIGR